MLISYDILSIDKGKNELSVMTYNRFFVPMASAEVTMVPQNYVELTSEEDIKKMNKILDLLDEDDDVQAVYHNWDE